MSEPRIIEERIGRDAYGHSFYFPCEITHVRQNPEGVLCLLRRDEGVVGYIDPATGELIRGNPPRSVSGK